MATKVSTLAQLNASLATFTYTITNASTDGKTPVGGANGLAINDAAGYLAATGGVFNVAGAASLPGVAITGVPFAGTGTNAFPQLYVNSNTATASTTLNTAGTALGVNSHGTADLANFMLDGVSKFSVNNYGFVSVGNGLHLTAGTQIYGSGSALYGNFLFNATGVVFSRTVADANPAMVINQASAGSTGDIIDFQSQGATKVLVSQAGDLKISAVGNGLYVKEGTNATMGRAVLVAGTVTVSTTKASATMEVNLTHRIAGGTLGVASVGTVAAGTSFVINSSSNTDTSTINWWIVEPA